MSDRSGFNRVGKFYNDMPLWEIFGITIPAHKISYDGTDQVFINTSLLHI